MSFTASIAGSKAIVSVLAIGAGGVLGYNWVTTGCPSGVCPTERAAAKVTPAALETELPACCAELEAAACGDASLCTDMAASCDDMTASCDEKSDCDEATDCTTEQAELLLVNTTTEEKSDACCPLTEAAEQTASNTP